MFLGSFVRSLRSRLDRRFGSERVNFWCHVTDGVFIAFGMAVVSRDFVFTSLAKALDVTPVVFGYLISLGAVASFIPVVLAPRIEGVRLKRRFVAITGIGMRLPALLRAIVLLLLAAKAPVACIVAIAVVGLFGGISGSLLIPPWMDLVAETVPPKDHGKLFGYRAGFSMMLAVGAGGVGAAVFSAFKFPGNYVVLYLVSFGLMAISWLAFVMVDEIPPEATHSSPPPAKGYYREILSAMRADIGYRWYLAYRALGGLSNVVAPFYALAAIARLDVSTAYVLGIFMTCMMGSSALMCFVMPRFAAMLGYRRTLGLAAALEAAAAVMAALGQTKWAYAAVFVLAGLAGGCKTVALAPFAMEISPRGRRVGYIALTMALMAVTGAVAAPLAGYGLTAKGPGAVFGVAAAAVLASALALERCRPPKENPGDGEAKVPAE